MGLTFSLIDSGEGQFGQLRYQLANVTFDSSYATGGEALPTNGVGAVANVLGMMYMGALDVTSAGIIAVYKPSTKKILAMRSGGFTPAGTNAASTVTGNVVVVGGGIGEAIGINPDTNAGVLSKAAATNRTIPVTTFLGGALTAPAQTFTGTAVTAASLVEASGDLAAITFVGFFIGVG